MGAPKRPRTGWRPPSVTPRSTHPTGLRLAVPPGSAVCLRCRWLAPPGNAAGLAREHTRTTTHPTVFRPADDRGRPEMPIETAGDTG